MTRIRSTFKWLVFFVLVIGIGGAGTAWWYWRHSDQLLKEMILAKLAEVVPDWQISLDEARIDWENQSRIYLTDFRLKPPGERAEILTIPSAIVTIDGDLLKDAIHVVVRKVEFHDPHIRLIRYEDGSWNLDRLKLPESQPEFNAGFPELLLARASVEVLLYHQETSLSTKLSVERGDIKLIPKARQVYQVDGSVELMQAGVLELRGEWDIARHRWRLDGAMQNLAVDRSLMELLTEVSPPSRDKLAQVEQRMHEFAHRMTSEPSRTLDRVFETPAPDFVPERIARGYSPLVQISHQELAVTEAEAGGVLPDFGLSGNINLNFRLSQTTAGEPVDYRVLATVSKGQLDNPLLPFPLRELEGKAYLDRTQVLIRDVRAVNGETEITLNADFNRVGQALPGTIRGRVTNLPITDRLKKLAKPELHKVYDLMHPTGNVDVTGTLKYDGFGRWEQDDVVYTVRNGTAQPDPFSYRVQEIAGTITPSVSENGDVHYSYRFTGMMGRRPVTMTGLSRPLNQGGEALFDLWVDQLPIDDAFLSACQPTLRAMLQSLNLRGKTGGHMRLIRPAGEDQKYQQILEMKLSEGSVEYEKFKYPVDGLAANVKYDSRDGLWLFSDINGHHGDAKVTASATLTKNSDLDRLQLRVVLEDAPIDHQLERAMRDNYQRIWDELNPKGRVTAVTELVWIPSRNLLDVTMPSIRIRDGSLLLREFRYPLDQVEALLSYDDNRVDIREFKARHEETQIQAKGEFLQEPGGLWRMHFEDILVDDLQPDRQFRKALPESMRDGLETLSPDGPVSIKGRTLEFRGSDQPNTAVTAYWDLEGYVAGIELTAGVRVSNVHGKFTAKGTWDGRIVDGEGTIDLESAVVMGQQLSQIRGPFKVRDRMIMVGSPKSFSEPSQAADESEHLTARAFTGLLSLDVMAKIGQDLRDDYGRLPGEPTRYRLFLTLKDARLEDYAKRNIAGATDLRGIVNGQMQIEGSGDDTRNLTGRGAVVVKPAALYQLPIMLQIFQRLSFVPPDNTAFDEAVLVFNIRNEQFEFSPIDLKGNALSLRGLGTVRFDEKVDLEFFSTAPKSQIPIPVARELFNASSTGFVGVKVTGTISQPVAVVRTNMVLDRAMRDFLGTFQPFAPLFPGNGPPTMTRPGASFAPRTTPQTGQAIIRSPN